MERRARRDRQPTQTGELHDGSTRHLTGCVSMAAGCRPATRLATGAPGPPAASPTPPASCPTASARDLTGSVSTAAGCRLTIRLRWVQPGAAPNPPASCPTASARGSDWVCVNGGWMPARQSACTVARRPPTPAPPANCASIQPASTGSVSMGAGCRQTIRLPRARPAPLPIPSQRPTATRPRSDSHQPSTPDGRQRTCGGGRAESAPGRTAVPERADCARSRREPCAERCSRCR